MTNPANDILGQARQGSVAAIIQILNERLADSGIRTRAMFSDGILQLLCEAKTPEQLEKSFVVERVQQILEAIAPHRIRKVNVNSRIVREHQLLWLEEISRDPERFLLWSEIITLKQPNLLRRLQPPSKAPPSKVSLGQRQPVQPGRPSPLMVGIAGTTAAALLLAAVWAGRSGPTQVTEAPVAPVALPERPPEPGTEPAAAPETFATTVAPSEPAAATPPAPPAPAETAPPADPFADAVRLAEATSARGKTATTAAEWLELAASWQRASDLMAEVTPESDRYAIAQDRVKVYRANSQEALKQSKL
ncbi:hypothetical protein IQ241_06065 [Romeria aff. gracilis LEGE 07310]|uniref:Uncharacterized protein n=1 Tax=Vasconcelosia minhoensis LEGE 07310 TaxID=915328 RepID=A0A8J7A5L3_9CYAN|nr:hypothetical protein [Romeria gracilis]MBE9076862.1 hypothetical protein [Romeria aff. gracilis LEGE 07310]